MIKRHFEEIWSKGNLDLIDKLISTNHVFHDPAAPGVSGKEAYKQLVTMYHNAFPDIHFAIEETIAEGNKEFARWTGTGTHKGELMGIPPTGMKVTVTGSTIIHIDDGKIVEEWANWDTIGMMQQLGVITPGRPTPENYAWGAPSKVVGDPGDPETNKVMASRFNDEVWVQQNLDVLGEMFSANVLAHNPAIDFMYATNDLSSLKQAVTDYIAAFPDIHPIVVDMIAEGDKVVGRWICTGTHNGELAGIPPSGKKANWTGMTTYRFADGKIVEHWWAWDVMGLMKQITE